MIESAINHVSGSKGGVAGVYNRALHPEGRRELLAKWADLVAKLVGLAPL